MPMDWDKWQKSEKPSEPDLDKILSDFKKIGGRFPSAYIIIAIALAIWLASGVYIVAPYEAGLEKRFGQYTQLTEPGIHYHWPYPIETVAKPNITQVRRFEIGFRTVDPGPPPRYKPVEQESLMLTGDENIVDIEFIVQYKINNPYDYLFQVADPVKTIQDAAEAAMREVIGDSKIDDVLTAEKFRIQEQTKELLQEIMDRYDSGLAIKEVQLQQVQPPVEVIDAFKDVASAREDQNRFINEAEGYANDILPKAKGKAEELVRQAEGYKESKIKRAQGDAARFTSLLTEYKKAKDVTRKRLYLETMEEVLENSGKFILPEAGGVLPLLNLDGAVKLAQPREEKDR